MLAQHFAQWPRGIARGSSEWLLGHHRAVAQVQRRLRSGGKRPHLSELNGFKPQIREHDPRFICQDKDGDRCIHHAAYGNEPKVIDLIVSFNNGTLKNIVDINSRNKRRQTALHISVSKGYVDMVKTLLKHGAHPSLQDAQGDTPLHDAIIKENDEIVRILLEHNVHIAVTNNNGLNPVQLAALRGNSRLVELLNGIDCYL